MEGNEDTFIKIIAFKTKTERIRKILKKNFDGSNKATLKM
jgi:hypothetical protein